MFLFIRDVGERWKLSVHLGNKSFQPWISKKEAYLSFYMIKNGF
jgi:hypothetical protein